MGVSLLPIHHRSNGLGSKVLSDRRNRPLSTSQKWDCRQQSDALFLVHFCAPPIFETQTGKQGFVNTYIVMSYKWAGMELNHRHTDFQSVALPTELPALTLSVIQTYAHFRTHLSIGCNNHFLKYRIRTRAKQEQKCAKLSSYPAFLWGYSVSGHCRKISI